MNESTNNILMCPPDYFSVDYVINPWMAGQAGQPNKKLAHQQWEHLRDEIAKSANITIIEPQPDLPDMVFTANAGVVAGDKAIASHFMPHERRPEEAYFKSGAVKLVTDPDDPLIFDVNVSVSDIAPETVFKTAYLGNAYVGADV